MRLSLLLGLLVALLSSPVATAADGPLWVFAGTYTGKKSQGIYRVEFDPATGKLGKPELAAEVPSPSFLAVAPDRKHLFCVCEIDNFGGKKAGGVTSFGLDAKSGELKPISQQSTVGPGPCHLVCDKAGKNVLVANYGGGSVAVLPVGSDGILGAASCFVQHTGTSADKDRQEAPHAHSVNLDATNHFAMVCDLGLDKVLVYKFDPAQGKITPNDPPAFQTAPGAGPRHFAFHPDGKRAYIINELNSTLTACDYDPDRGVLTGRQTVSTLLPGFRGNTSTAEVVVHPSGKFVYGSNRGHNSIAAFAIEPSGTLKPVGHQGEGVKTPRNFNIDPSGKWMIVANQDGDSLVVFAVDPDTGALKLTGQKVEVGSPVCVKFVPKS